MIVLRAKEGMKVKQKKGILAGMLAAALLISGMAGTDVLAVAKAGVKLDKSEVVLTADKTVTLKVKKTGVKKIISIKWLSKNKKVAMVSKKGKVTAKKAGTATIKCVVKYRTKGGSETREKTLACKIKVASGNQKALYGCHPYTD